MKTLEIYDDAKPPRDPDPQLRLTQNYGPDEIMLELVDRRTGHRLPQGSVARFKLNKDGKLYMQRMRSVDARYVEHEGDDWPNTVIRDISNA